MKGFFKSKLVLSLTLLVMSAAVIAIPFSGKVTQVHAASRIAHTTLAAGDSPQQIGGLYTSGGGGGGGLSPAVALTLCICYGVPIITFTLVLSKPMHTNF